MAGLSITQLALAQFRSHAGLRLDVDARPVALYGPNGAGKTNILEAVSLLSPGRGLRRAAAAEMARAPGEVGWKVTAALSGPGGEHEVETWSDGGAARQLRLDGKPAPQAALGRLARVLWLVPAMDRLWTEGAEGRRRFLDRITMSLMPGHGETSLAYEKAMRERNRLLRDEVRDPAWYAAIEAQMARNGGAITAARQAAIARLTAAQEGAATAFPTAGLALAGPPAAKTQAALAAALSEGRGRDLAAGRSLTGPHRADLDAELAAKGVPARAASTGEQKALLIALVLANARALAADTGAAPVLLLDEVAAHLDAGRRAALFDEIAALGAQAWMTGTGRELFAELGDRAQFLEVTARDGLSAVRTGGTHRL